MRIKYEATPTKRRHTFLPFDIILSVSLHFVGFEKWVMAWPWVLIYSNNWIYYIFNMSI